MDNRLEASKTGDWILKCAALSLEIDNLNKVLLQKAVRRAKRKANIKKLRNMAILAAIAVSLILIVRLCHAETGIASYFSRESCIKEGSLTLMSNGKELNDASLVCASWKYPLGTKVRIISCGTGKSVICKVSTRGPGRKDGTSKYYRGKRIIDLSVSAFSKIARLEQGIIKVTVEKI